jgi:hypothetical protein
MLNTIRKEGTITLILIGTSYQIILVRFPARRKHSGGAQMLRLLTINLNAKNWWRKTLLSINGLYRIVLNRVMTEAASMALFAFLRIVEDVDTSTDRSFGLVMAVAFAGAAGYVGWLGSAWWPGLLGLGAIFLMFATTQPALLAPLNRMWNQVSVLLGVAMALVIIALIYFGIIMPMVVLDALLARFLARPDQDPGRSRGQHPEPDKD